MSAQPGYVGGREKGYAKATAQGLATGAVVGAALGWLLGLFTVVQSLVGAIVLAIWGVVIGGVIGMVVGLIGHALSGGRRDFSSVSTVRAQHYDVLAEVDVAQEAQRALAEIDPETARSK